MQMNETDEKNYLRCIQMKKITKDGSRWRDRPKKLQRVDPDDETDEIITKNGVQMTRQLKELQRIDPNDMTDEKNY